MRECTYKMELVIIFANFVSVIHPVWHSTKWWSIIRLKFHFSLFWKWWSIINLQFFQFQRLLQLKKKKIKDYWLTLLYKIIIPNLLGKCNMPIFPFNVWSPAHDLKLQKKKKTNQWILKRCNQFSLPHVTPKSKHKIKPSLKSNKWIKLEKLERQRERKNLEMATLHIYKLLATRFGVAPSPVVHLRRRKTTLRILLSLTWAITSRTHTLRLRH